MQNETKTSNAEKNDQHFDAAKGAVFGAFIGDATGAYLEFTRKEITPELLEECMKLPGGGVHRVAKGQVTDDSELAMCLARAIAEVMNAPPFVERKGQIRFKQTY